MSGSQLGATCDATPTAPSPACDETIGQQVTALINGVRGERGLGALTVDLRLIEAAQGHSQDMADNGFVGHTGADGSDAGARIDRTGYPWNYYSENVAAGQPSADAVVSAWMGSDGHRANILSPDAGHLGVGYVQKAATEYTRYWTVNFGSTTGPDVAPSEGCHP